MSSLFFLITRLGKVTKKQNAIFFGLMSYNDSNDCEITNIAAHKMQISLSDE